ncbi:MAG: hypothetical protein AAF360_03635, partial [Pseudomonadota bacterium]
TYVLRRRTGLRAGGVVHYGFVSGGGAQGYGVARNPNGRKLAAGRFDGGLRGFGARYRGAGVRDAGEYASGETLIRPMALQ